MRYKKNPPAGDARRGIFSALQLGLRLGQELRRLDDKALVGAPADLAGLVVGGHIEGDLLAVHGGDLGLGPDLHADGGGGGVGHVQMGAHGALVLGQIGHKAGGRGVFHQGDHIRGGEHGHKAGADGVGGVLAGDDGVGAALQANFDRHTDFLLK